MRISDWSSDVCSSDLRATPRLAMAARTAPALDSSAAHDRRAPQSEGRCRQDHARAAPCRTMDEARAPRPADRRRSPGFRARLVPRSEEHTSELQSLMRISYAVFCLKKKTNQSNTHTHKS